MASNHFVQETVDGQSLVYKRTAKQGRKPLGLAKLAAYRLYQVDADRLAELVVRLDGFNVNEFVRNAVHGRLNSVYTELLKL